MDTIGKRVKKLRFELNYKTQTDFAKFLGTTQANISNYEGENSIPRQDFFDLCHKKIPNLNIEWLQFGEGEIFVNTKDTGLKDELPDDIIALKEELKKTQNKLREAEIVINYFMQHQKQPTQQFAR